LFSFRKIPIHVIKTEIRTLSITIYFTISTYYTIQFSYMDVMEIIGDVLDLKVCAALKIE
jgi:hypothetical protein